MMDLPVVISGAFIGLSIAAPIGPMGILCINRTLAEGMTIGVMTGLGATTVHLCYGGVVLLGLQQAGPWVERNGHVMSIVAATLMLLFSLKLLRRPVAVRSSKRAGRISRLIAYGSAVIFNLANPLTVILLLGAVTSVFGSRAPTEPEISLLLVGLFVGSAFWWLCLSSAISVFRRRLPPATLKSINRIAAAILFGFGLLAIAHAMAEVGV